ncbi:hypothetical protein RJ639_006896 [Escallonia herrerae]|uniref:Uncharacterized protein n=1 Tax=Escallonia herrerae TaxID=1293975 RepID=A0AA89AW06_9ASTE|nr:hypothetical protein RJ639_006896 [Escallonia herrerae]
MEVAVIDWKSLDSKFVKDELYEHISAPQWVDLSAPDVSVDDEAWFCRPDCKHPKVYEDFLNQTPPSKSKVPIFPSFLDLRAVFFCLVTALSSTDVLDDPCFVKLHRSISVSGNLPFGDWSQRDAALKKRGFNQPRMSLKKNSTYDRLVEDGENQNPNLSTPPNNKSRFLKQAVKSSTEKKQVDSFLREEEKPRLKSKLSAQNLFAGRDILNQITDFCSELKRLAMRAKERENVEESAKKSPLAVKQEFKEYPYEREKERKPLLDMSKEKCEAIENSSIKEKQRRKKRYDEAENTPISVDLKSIRLKEQESLLQIRTNPPSPQCFSAKRVPSKATPPKAFGSRPPERGVLQELEQSNKEVKKEEAGDRGNHGTNVCTNAEREARTLDVFWFLKPCTLSS